MISKNTYKLFLLTIFCSQIMYANPKKKNANQDKQSIESLNINIDSQTMNSTVNTLNSDSAITNIQNSLKNLNELSQKFFIACGEGNALDAESALMSYIQTERKELKSQNDALKAIEKFVNQRDADGNTPLIYAIKQCHLSDLPDASFGTVIYLLSIFGTDFKAKNNNGCDVFDVAINIFEINRKRNYTVLKQTIEDEIIKKATNKTKKSSEYLRELAAASAYSSGF
ncbi:hypothetical protein JKY79_03800 [Candidatus Babeliales bacterium]|nr:hypothetical protein [Candidatus Babeliales bacterium]